MTYEYDIKIIEYPSYIILTEKINKLGEDGWIVQNIDSNIPSRNVDAIHLHTAEVLCMREVKSDKDKAIEWWNNHTTDTKQFILMDYNKDLLYKQLDDDMIIKIYKDIVISKPDLSIVNIIFEGLELSVSGYHYQDGYNKPAFDITSVLYKGSELLEYMRAMDKNIDDVIEKLVLEQN